MIIFTAQVGYCRSELSPVNDHK